MELADKIAIVTGGTNGLGLAIAQRFAQAGATVVCASRSGGAAAPAAAGLSVARVDVRDPASVRDLVDRTVDRHGRLDVMVANAGVMRDGKVDQLAAGDLRDMVDTNFYGTFHCLQAAAAPMLAQRAGCILTISSTIASHPAPGTGGYAATKAAIEALTRTAGIELARHGVRVNCLAPGFLEGGMTRAVIDNERVWQAYLKRFAMRRAGTFPEAADAALWLASDGSAYVNAAILPVDGGLSWP
jgi:3-oxoacyl-[acyl-carrier protein] reductase